MGMDGIELLMEVEAAFDIKIDDNDAQNLLTVGDMYDYVVAKVDIAPTGTCLTAAAFYDVRAGLLECGIDERFGPSTLLSKVIPKSGRRLLWWQLSNHTQFRLPNLVRPKWIVDVGIYFTLAVSVFAAYYLTRSDVFDPIQLFVVFPCLAVFGYLYFVLTTPFATEIDQSFMTFRRLCENLVVLNASNLRSKHGPMGRNDIWFVLSGLIVDTLCVDMDEITREAHFVKDLGCD